MEIRSRKFFILYKEKKIIKNYTYTQDVKLLKISIQTQRII